MSAQKSPPLSLSELHAVREALDVLFAEAETQSDDECKTHSTRTIASARSAHKKVCAAIAAGRETR